MQNEDQFGGEMDRIGCSTRCKVAAKYTERHNHCIFIGHAMDLGNSECWEFFHKWFMHVEKNVDSVKPCEIDLTWNGFRYKTFGHSASLKDLRQQSFDAT